MAYNVENLTKLGALKQLAEKIKAGYATKEDLSAQISTKLSSIYKAGGSVAFADLPELAEANLGLVVNVTDAFTTTDSFTDGAGSGFPAGTNVAVVKSGEEYKYDVLSGFVDLSGYVEKEDGKGLSSNDFTDAEKARLAAVNETIAGAVRTATTTMDDNFGRRYGLDYTDVDDILIKFKAAKKYSSTIEVNKSDTLQEVAAMLCSEGLWEMDHVVIDVDDTLGYVAHNAAGPIDITISECDSEYNVIRELTYIPTDRVGPMFSFNGRSGMVVPQAGDYTPAMIGLTFASDAEVTDMLDEVFGTAS